MLVLLLIACVGRDEGPGPEPVGDDTAHDDTGQLPPGPPIAITADIDGVALRPFVDGFVAIEDTQSARTVLVQLTTYAGPCEALTGYWNELATRTEENGGIPPNDAEQQAVAADWAPEGSWDVLELAYTIGVASALEGELPVGNLAGQRGVVDLRLEIGRSTEEAYSLLNGVDGTLVVSAADPYLASGDAAVSGMVRGVGAVEGTLGFSFELPRCDTYEDAVQRYLDSIQGGC